MSDCAARTMWSRSMPACSSSSAGVPDVGISRTASVTMPVRDAPSAKTSRTASLIPLGVAVVDGEDRAGRLGRFDKRAFVDGLDRVEVHDPGGDPLVRELVGGGEHLVERDPRRGERDLVRSEERTTREPPISKRSSGP